MASCQARRGERPIRRIRIAAMASVISGARAVTRGWRVMGEPPRGGIADCGSSLRSPLRASSLPPGRDSGIADFWVISDFGLGIAQLPSFARHLIRPHILAHCAVSLPSADQVFVSAVMAAPYRRVVWGIRRLPDRAPRWAPGRRLRLL